MKIAQIAPPWLRTPPDNYGGAEEIISTLVEEQVAQGHDVTLFAPGDAKTSAHLVSFIPTALREDHIPWAAHLKAFYHLFNAVAAAKDFDIIHTHLSSGADLYIYPLTASLATPHVTTLHSHFPFDHIDGWTGNADDFYLRKWGADVPIVAISKHALREIPEHVNTVGIVYNGLPMRELEQQERQREDFLVWIGRFSPEKGPDVAIEAAKRANRSIVLGGTIDEGSAEKKNYFYEVIKPLIDDKRVRYVGPVDKTQKVELLNQAYGFLNPINWEEPFGMVMIEAMALGCPVISFTRGAASELIEHGKTGFLVQDLDEMVQTIPRLEQIDRSYTRQHVEQHFSARAMAQGYMQVYQKIIGHSRP
jgi:glycosyltransferase involved in cell wall biosynthesis